MKDLNKLILQLTLVASVVRQATTQGPEDTTNAAVDDYCTEQAYGDALISALQARLSNSQARAKQLSADVKLLALAAARYAGTPKGPGYAALHTMAQERLSKQVSSIEENQQVIAQGIAAISRKLGELAGLEALTQGTYSKGAQATAPTAANGILQTTPVLCQTKATYTAKSTIDCSRKKESYATVQGVKHHLEKLKTLALRSAQSVKAATLTLTMEASPNINLAGAALSPIAGEPGCYKTASGSAATTNADAIAIRQPELTAMFTKGDLNIESLLQERRRQATPPAPADPTTTTSILTSDADLAHAFERAQRAAIETPERVLEQDIEAIVAEQAAQETAKHVLAGASEGSKLKGEPSKLVKKLFGGDGAKLKESFFDPLKNDKTTIPDGDGKIEGSTQVIAEGPNFAAEMAYYNTLNLKKTVAEATGETKTEGNGKADSEEKKKRRTGIIKQQKLIAKPLKKVNVTKQNALRSSQN
uniref:Variant surface glycoprotein 1125.1729 n=1 Tax=Trypanosoma brucei TaxID=5691 RepID=A0A1J0R7W2_9TRYP|nr:variant surface glycoprotein 1125.1729 [Trypanosoma brucei]